MNICVCDVFYHSAFVTPPNLVALYGWSSHCPTVSLSSFRSSPSLFLSHQLIPTQQPTPTTNQPTNNTAWLSAKSTLTPWRRMRSARMRLISRRLASCVLWPTSRPRSAAVPKKSGPFSSGTLPYLFYFLPCFSIVALCLLAWMREMTETTIVISCFSRQGTKWRWESECTKRCVLSNGVPFFFFCIVFVISGNTSGALSTSLQNPPYGAPFHAAKVRGRTWSHLSPERITARHDTRHNWTFDFGHSTWIGQDTAVPS